MKRLLFAILLALWAVPSWASCSNTSLGNTWTCVNSTGAFAPSTYIAVTTSGITTTGANLLVYKISHGSVASYTLTDSKGNVPTCLTEVVSFDTASQTCYQQAPIVGASHTVTITCAGAVPCFPSVVFIAYFSSGGLPLYNGVQHSNIAVGTSIAPGSTTPLSSNALLVTGLTAYNITATIDSSFTIEEQQVDPALEDYSVALANLTQSSASAVNPTWSWSGSVRAVSDILVFAPSTCTGASPNLTAASASSADVNSCALTAVDGDVISVPAGSATWTSGVAVPSNIGVTIKGAGTPDSSTADFVPSASCSSGGTVITGSGDLTFFTFSPQFGNAITRLSCMTIVYGAGGALEVGFNIGGTCTGSGCPNLRLDNITFNNWSSHANAGISYGIGSVGDMFGVVDHNQVNGTGGTYLPLVEQNNAAYLGVGQYGDNSWHLSENYGSANFLFMENNTFVAANLNENESSGLVGIPAVGGSRLVARYNQFSSMDNLSYTLGWHGTETNARSRGGRAFEYYRNTYTAAASTALDTVAGPRSGTGMAFENTITVPASSSLNNYMTLNTYRRNGSQSSDWGPCDGSIAYDVNDGMTYFSGTVASGGGTKTITVSGSPGWSANQWVPAGAPYSLHDVTAANGAEITANGSNTLSIIGDGPVPWTITNGDSIQILRATVCIDQASGRGAGILYSGSPASPSSSATEALSPLYQWTTSFPTKQPTFNATTGLAPNSGSIIRNREFYTEDLNQTAQTNATSPFDGTTSKGMGHGTLAFRPTTCTTGVGYWATDQGSWNASGSGGQGLLYLCTSTNTWTLSYTPYIYPHPLDANPAGGGGGPRLIMLGVGND